MNKLNLLILIFWSFSTAMVAQSFEGIIEMHQTTSNGMEYDLTWYIKGNQLAYELSTSSGGMDVQIRFVPQKAKNSMLMIAGDTKREIPASEIIQPDEISLDGAKVAEKNLSATKDFKEMKQLEIITDAITANVEVTTDIKINFAEYAAFFKKDYGLCALVKSGKEGFPLSSVTKDKSGKILTKTTLEKVTRTMVSDAYFQ